VTKIKKVKKNVLRLWWLQHVPTSILLYCRPACTSKTVLTPKTTSTKLIWQKAASLIDAAIWWMINRLFRTSEIGATRCQIFRRKCTKLGFCPRLPCGSLQRSPRPPIYSYIEGGLLLREGEGRERKGKERGENERGKEREGRNGNIRPHPIHISGYATASRGVRDLTPSNTMRH